MQTFKLFKNFLHAAGGILLLLTCAIGTKTAAAGVEVNCEGSAEAYRIQGIPCDCVGGRIVCNDGSSGGGSSGKKSGGLSHKNQMKLEIMQSVADMAANAFLRWLNDPGPAQRAPTPEELAAARAKQEREKAEWQARIQKQISEMETRYAEQERQNVKAKSAKLMSRLKGIGSSSAEPQSDLLEQLRCKAYWGHKAATEPDVTLAYNYSRFAEEPDAEALAECGRALPEPPMPSAAEAFKIDLYQTIVQEINQRLPLIEKAKEKQRDAVTQLAGKQQQVKELKTRQEQVPSAAEKQAADDLLAAALQELDAATALKNEADAGVMQLQLEIDAFQQVEKIAANN
ncbi:MAG: hypothetical protein C4519_06825 [Desulfobacteraceae bacterium]|nr:MAG: hypothetical protein C4519_06825 [Desulfobacteraceae bacterium]